jgi:hypothetical protein
MIGEKQKKQPEAEVGVRPLSNFSQPSSVVREHELGNEASKRW